MAVASFFLISTQFSVSDKPTVRGYNPVAFSVILCAILLIMNAALHQTNVLLNEKIFGEDKSPKVGLHNKAIAL